MPMDQLDLAVVNGTVVLGHGRYRLAIGVKGGKVVALAPEEHLVRIIGVEPTGCTASKVPGLGGSSHGAGRSGWPGIWRSPGDCEHKLWISGGHVSG